MVDLTPIVSAVITLAVALITVFVVPYLRAKLGAEKLDTIKFWVNIAVEAAEMIYTGKGRGKEKKEYVVNFLKSKGFSLDVEEIENIIEAAVLELKLTQKEEA